MTINRILNIHIFDCITLPDIFIFFFFFPSAGSLVFHFWIHLVIDSSSDDQMLVDRVFSSVNSGSEVFMMNTTKTGSAMRRSLYTSK